MSAFDAVAPAPRHRSAVDWLSQLERFKEVRQATTVSFEGIGEDRRGNADKVDPGIGRTRLLARLPLKRRERAEGGRGDRLLVLLAVLARVRGAEFDLAVHAGER